MSFSRHGARFVMFVAAVFTAQTAWAECVIDDSSNVRSLPLASIDNLEYVGGFTLPADTFGQSSMNGASPIMEKFGNSLFIAGHVSDDAIAEFAVPELVNSTNINDLNSAGAPVQNFSTVLNRAPSGNGEGIDQINGLEVFGGQLIVNGIEYYDGSADNTDTTLVVSNASDIAGSSIKGYHRLPGGAKAAGWITELPAQWQTELGRTHIVGSSSGDPIKSRHSIGPSAYTVNANEIVSATSTGEAIASTKLLEFTLDNPLHEDLYNSTRQNDIWTHSAKAVFGFVVPGTRTYATFGSLTGGESGLGYKITQDNGNLCPGYCSYEAGDRYNYYWFWDMNDLLDVKAGAKESYSVRPYAYGKFNVPFQGSGHNEIAGGSFDTTENILYFSIDKANNTLGRYSNPPVIAAYRIPGF